MLAQLPGYILINFYLLGSIPFLVIYALVLLARSLRTFRLPMHRMARRPGIVACFAIMLGVGVAVFCMLARLALSAFVQTSMRKVNFLEIAGMFTQRIWISGSFVAGAWLALILTSGWRPEPDWVDRAGRVLGICLVVTDLIVMSL